MVVICRIDLDKFDLQQIETLVCQQILTLPEARNAKSVKALSAVQELQWARMMQAKRKVG